MSSSVNPWTVVKNRKTRRLEARQRAEGEQQIELAPTAAEQPPVARLYRHALESIFSFLPLHDLSRVLAVSRSWQSAVGSMRSIDATVTVGRSSRSSALFPSRLARHIGTLGSEDRFAAPSQKDLRRADVQARGLHTLFYKPSSMPFGLPLFFPESLTQLNVELKSDSDSRDVNAIIAACRPLAKLAALTLSLPHLDSLVSFAPLRHLPQLRIFSFEVEEDDWQISQAQVNELRSLSQLTDLNCMLSHFELRSILRAPHQLKWQKLHMYGPTTRELVVLLASLSLLTDITVTSKEDVISFLQSLPNLRALTLRRFALEDNGPLHSPEQRIAGIGQCAQLTSLTIGCSDLTSTHMSALLSLMPALSKLELRCMHLLDSLRFLSSEALQRSLTSLTIQNCDHESFKARELRHVFTLTHLARLRIEDSFADALDSLTLLDLEVPSPRMPKLQTSVVKFKVKADEEDDEEPDDKPSEEEEEEGSSDEESSEGTRWQRFKPFAETTTVKVDGVPTVLQCAYQSITTMPGYRHKSFEELRIEDEEIGTDAPTPAASRGESEAELSEEEQE